jgi:arginyl-tRNA--protein-N-Asp/Glu arginylyltransferase
MSKYPCWDLKKIENYKIEDIEEWYDKGYVFTRKKNEIYQIRSLRVKAQELTLSSENKRILRKTQDFGLRMEQLSDIKNFENLAKKAESFYKERFGELIFSSQKISELLTESVKSNYNYLAIYSDSTKEIDIGWCICFVTKNVLHYAYPWYELEYLPQNIGAGMMLNTILWAKENDIQNVYLGSVWDLKSKYKLQFSRVEYFDKQSWKDAKNLKLE